MIYKITQTHTHTHTHH